MPIQFEGRDRMPELRRSHLSSSSSPACNYAYPYVISTPSDAAESGNGRVPIAEPWPESKPTFSTNNPSRPSEEEEHEEDDIDAELKAVLESFQELYKRSEVLFKKVFSKVLQDNLLQKGKKEEHADPKRKAFLESRKKKMSRILKRTKRSETKAVIFQRSLSLDSPRSPLERFKIKPPNLGGGGPHDIKGSPKDC